MLTFSYNEPADLRTFIFAKSGELNLYSTTFRGVELREKSMPVSLKVDRPRGVIDIAIGPRHATIRLPELRKTDCVPIRE